MAILLLSPVPIANAAPSGAITVEADNVLQLGESGQVVVTFKNTATDISDVASTVQYITLAAANLNPSRTLIDTTAPAPWSIHKPDGTMRTGSTVAGTATSELYAPYSITDPVSMATWGLGSPSGTLAAYTDVSQFAPVLKVLQPQETLKLTVTIECQNVVGDSRIWFFFKATETAYASGSYPTDLATIDSQYRVNLYYSKLPGPVQTQYWLPLHNSYDPYDQDIGTGHNFGQHSWTRGETTRAFAKANKLVHQKPVETPTPCIHIVKNGPATAQVGQLITYNYTVTNCGTEALNDVKAGVTDSLLITVNYDNGDTNTNDKLDIIETWLFTSTYTVLAGDAPTLENTATATGTGDTSGTEVTHSADFSIPLTGPTPQSCIHIVKDGPAAAQVGQTITYNYAVTNCGTEALNSVKTGVTDSRGIAVNYVSGDTDNDGKLDTTETWLFTSSYTVQAGDPPTLVNTATATGTGDTSGTEVTHSASFSVPISQPPPPGEGTFSFHICGEKFQDSDRDGVYSFEAERGIDGVTVMLLGPDQTTKGIVYYPELSYPPPEDASPDILPTGENQLEGSYCFNLVAGLAASGKTYTFYIKIVEPAGRVATSPTLIGPIELEASADGGRESLGNHFGNAPPPPPPPVPIGGAVLSVSKLELLAPWIGLAALASIAVLVAVAVRRPKA